MSATQRPNRLANQGISHVTRAATILSVAMALSRILGFFRNSVISAEFGQNRATDILNAAYYIPDTIYLILVGGGMSTAFIPILSRYLSQGREDEGWRVASIAYNVILILMLTVLAAAIVFAPTLVGWIVPGFGSAALADTVLLTRIMFLSILFHSLNGVLIGSEYAYQSFLGTAIGPLIYNAAIIGVGVALVPHLRRGPGPIDMRIMAFAIATAVGSFLNFLIQLWGVARLKPRYTFSVDFRHEGMVQFVRLAIPVMIGLSFVQLNFFINQTFLASYLPRGSLNALTLASRVILIPIMVAISVGIAILPRLAQVAQAHDWSQYRSLFSGSLGTVVFISIPSSLGLIVLAHPVIAVLFQHGQFHANDTARTALALTGYSFGIAAYAGYEIVSRGFYALEDTKTPLIASAANLALSVLLNWVGVHLFQLFGLALAYSVTGFTNIVFLTYLLRRRHRRSLGLGKVMQTATKTLLASVVMAIIVEIAERLVLPFGDLVGLLVPLAIGVLVFSILALALRIPEARRTMSLVLRRLGVGA